MSGRGNIKIFTEEEQAYIEKRWNSNEETSMKQIAKELGTQSSQVKAYLISINADLRRWVGRRGSDGVKRPRPDRSLPLMEQYKGIIDEVVKLRGEGMNKTNIARKLHTTSEVIAEILKNLGMPDYRCGRHPGGGLPNIKKA